MQRGYNLRLETIDKYVWQAVGNYGMSALITALDVSFNGRKAKSEYIREPVLFEKEEAIELTKEEFDKLPQDEKEKIVMQTFDSAMEDTVKKFNEKGQRVR
jgi:hypothetical protein